MTEMVIFFRLFIYKWMKTVGKLFIKEFGLSPQEYVQQRKLSERGIINNGQHGA